MATDHEHHKNPKQSTQDSDDFFKQLSHDLLCCINNPNFENSIFNEFKIDIKNDMAFLNYLSNSLENHLEKKFN